MRTQRNLVTGIAAAALALTGCGIAAGTSGTPARHAAGTAGQAPAAASVTGQGDLAQAKRHIKWTTGDPAGAQQPQADPSRATDQRDLAKAKRDVVLHAGQQARGR